MEPVRLSKSYDQRHRRLVYTGVQASPHFWDGLWKSDDPRAEIEDGKNDHFVTVYTKKFIIPNRSKKILEGGCGKGNLVYALTRKGYDAYGVDYADQTVEAIHRVMPELQVQSGDVRKLPFSDGLFDGYWSLGVIEHFYDGYDPILREMHRVLKKGGYLFLTFPSLSLFRKLKASLHRYGSFDAQTFDQNSFYQFALDAEKVRSELEQQGFLMVYKKRLDGMKGLLDETYPSPLGRLLSRLYQSHHLPIVVARALFSRATAPFFGHITLLVCKKI